VAAIDVGGWPRSHLLFEPQMRVAPVPRTWGPGTDIEPTRKTPKNTPISPYFSPAFDCACPLPSGRFPLPTSSYNPTFLRRQLQTGRLSCSKPASAPQKVRLKADLPRKRERVPARGTRSAERLPVAAAFAAVLILPCDGERRRRSRPRPARQSRRRRRERRLSFPSRRWPSDSPMPRRPSTPRPVRRRRCPRRS
jgi:hypothetical protein